MKLLICGDTVPTQASADDFRTGNTEALFHDVVPLFHSSDRVLVNVECALTDRGTPIPKFGPNLKGPVESAATLKKAGVTDCGLSNNHTFDFGIEGFEDTIRLVQEAGMNVTGVGSNEKASRSPL
ncbi:MAG: CapA family protein, partial [Clostridia bacterium]|nr:CapA family protein [Clostridia bacterium]